MALPFRKSALILATSLAVAACGGGGGSSKKNHTNPDDGNDPTVQTGIFVDSPVAGIGYRTATQDGFTNELGEYNYLPGEKVTFFIGGLEFPEVTASGMVTPADIAADPAVRTNILQILQTLDDDGDPSNGISIREEATAAFTGPLPDLTDPNFDTQVQAILTEIDPSLTLVEEKKAEKHFQDSLKTQLLGSWMYSEGPGKRNVLTFIDESTYIIIHEHADDGDQKAGSVEFGRYDWDPLLGEFTVFLDEEGLGESDGSGGLYDEGSSFVAAKLDGNTLTLTERGDGEEVSFIRIVSATNPLIGGWFLWEEDKANGNILTFLSGSEYVIAHTNNDGKYEQREPRSAQALSGEFGTYQLDANGNFRALSATVDTDGDGGLFNAESEDDQQGEILTALPWGDLRFIEEDEGTFSFVRLGSFPVTLQDTNADNKLGTIHAVRDLMGLTPDYLSNKLFGIDVNLEDGSTSTFELNFKNDYAYDPNIDRDKGTVTVTVVNEEASFEGEWTINSAGTVVVTFTDNGIPFTMTIAPLQAPKVLLSLESSEESSLWESVLRGPLI